MRRARRRRAALGALVLAALLAASVASGPASAADRAGTAKVKVGRIDLSVPQKGRASLLIPVSYPIQAAGRRVELRVSLAERGRLLGTWSLRPRANAGPPPRPERRTRFQFVVRLELSRGLTMALGRGLRAQVRASGAVDVNSDGKFELDSTDLAARALPRIAGGRRLCSGVPQLQVKPGRPVAVTLPVCGVRTRWRIAGRPAHGTARILGGRLVYRSFKRFRGTEPIALVGRGQRIATASGARIAVPVVFKVGTAQDAVVRAIGDSVTAGFGYYDNGKPMTIGQLLGCKPPASAYDDACSSNSVVRSNEAKKVEYAPDYGLSNNVSWVAQWANAHGITNFENLAVSGSEPSDWAPGGQFYVTTKRVESEHPDFVLMTVGANPLLSDVLFGLENMGCAIESDITGGYRECIEKAFAEVHLRENLEKLYTELVGKTTATIYLMQYHLAIPSTALLYSSTQIAEMGKLVNREIARSAAAVNPKRLQVLAPPHFNVGIDISPVYPSSFSCSRFGFEVDGPSVQIDATQDELLAAHPLSFCSGPEEGPPWVISGDTGIHPSAVGYAQMASRVPAP